MAGMVGMSWGTGCGVGVGVTWAPSPGAAVVMICLMGPGCCHCESCLPTAALASLTPRGDPCPPRTPGLQVLRCGREGPVLGDHPLVARAYPVTRAPGLECQPQVL